MTLEKQLLGQIKKGLEDYVASSALVKQDYRSSTKWTTIIRNITEKSLRNIKNDSWNDEMLVFNDEWFKIDTLLVEYFNKDDHGKPCKYFESTIDGKKLWLYESRIRVAVEYENGKTIWPDELNKLAHIRCDLKVIISYTHPDGDTLDYYGLLQEKVKIANLVLNRCHPEAATDKWLLVFLPNTSLDLGRLVAYQMENGTFVEV